MSLFDLLQLKSGFVDMEQQSFESLIEGLDNIESGVRQSAAYYLGALGDKRAVEPLIHALDDNKPEVVSSAAWALGRLGDERAISPLIDHLDHPLVVHGLEDLGRNALLAVINALQTTQRKKRQSALQGIRQFLFLHKSWARPIIETLAFEPILQVLHDEDERTRGYAVVVLGDIGNFGAVPAIQELVEDPSDYVRWCAAWVLGILGDVTTIPTLEHMQENDTGMINVYHPEDEYFKEKISDVAAKSIEKIQSRNR